MGPLSGRRARLAAGCVLLWAAAVSCASPGAPSPGTAVQGTVTGSTTGPGGTAVEMTNGTPTPTGTASPTTPVPAGCPSGTVAITHSGAYTDTSSVCIKAGARLQLTLLPYGIGSWTPLQVAPDGAASVTSATDAAGGVRASVAPAGTASFCLSTATTDSALPTASWRLCVKVRR